MESYLILAGCLWLILQIAALRTMRGWWRNAAWLSAAAIALAVVVATLGVLDGSDLAPIWVVLALPVCLVWIAALWIIRGAVWLLTR